MPSQRVPNAERWLRVAPRPSSDPPPPDDAALIDAVVRRDVRRAGDIYDRLIPVVDMTLVRVLGGREPDHDDLVQAAFEQILMTLQRGRFAGASKLSTWAAAIATHVGLNALRARRRFRRIFEPERDDLPTTGSPRDAERDLGVREQIRAAQSHLAAMRPERATVVIMHDVLGHELTEIAAQLGISTTAAQSRLVRGRRQLLGRMGADGHIGSRDCSKPGARPSTGAGAEDGGDADAACAEDDHGTR